MSLANTVRLTARIAIGSLVVALCIVQTVVVVIVALTSVTYPTVTPIETVPPTVEEVHTITHDEDLPTLEEVISEPITPTVEEVTTPDYLSYEWNELRRYAKSLGITAKKKADILASLQTLDIVHQPS